MDDFQRYETLRDQGIDAPSIYRAGQSDGLNAITLIRMIRAVCGLTLAEAKEAADSGRVFERPQPVDVGATVYWDLNTSGGPSLIRKGRVLSQANGRVEVEAVEEYDMETGEVVPNPSLPEALTIPSGYFQKSLVERLEEAQRFWTGLTRQPQH